MIQLLGFQEIWGKNLRVARIPKEQDLFTCKLALLVKTVFQ